MLPAPDSHFMSGQPVVTCFLHEIIDEIEAGRSPRVEVSPFTELAIMATICEKVLNLKRELVTEYGGQGLTQGFYRQHQSVHALLVARLQIISGEISSRQGSPDSMWILLAITAHTAIFMLCETLESKQLGPGSLEAALTASKQRLLEGTRDMGGLVTILSQLNYFEVGSTRLDSAAP